MTDIAPNKPRRPPAKRPRISAAMRRAVDALVTGEAPTQKMAAALAGLSREHFGRELQKPHIKALVTQRSVEMFSALLPKAVRALDMVLDGENKAAALSGALAVLKQHGLIAPDGPPNVSINVSPGYVIDLREPAAPIGPPMIDVTPSEPDDGGEE